MCWPVYCGRVHLYMYCLSGSICPVKGMLFFVCKCMFFNSRKNCCYVSFGQLSLRSAPKYDTAFNVINITGLRWMFFLFCSRRRTSCRRSGSVWCQSTSCESRGVSSVSTSPTGSRTVSSPHRASSSSDTPREGTQPIRLVAGKDSPPKQHPSPASAPGALQVTPSYAY